MGLTKADAVALSQVLSHCDQNWASALCLGAPTTDFTRGWIEQVLVPNLGRGHLNWFHTPKVHVLSDIPMHAIVDFKRFLSMWGFDQILVLDIDSSEGATLNLDLNTDSLPLDFRRRFDLVLDGGTLEHCFNMSHALGLVHQALRDGGIAFHTNPANQMLDHGLFQISPTLYHDYYRSARYEAYFGGLAQVRPSRLVEVSIDRYTKDIYRSNGGHRFTRHLPVLSVVYAARRKALSISPSTIVQSYYDQSDAGAKEYTYSAMPESIHIRRKIFKF